LMALVPLLVLAVACAPSGPQLERRTGPIDSVLVGVDGLVVLDSDVEEPQHFTHGQKDAYGPGIPVVARSVLVGTRGIGDLRAATILPEDQEDATELWESGGLDEGTRVRIYSEEDDPDWDDWIFDEVVDL